MKKNNQNIESTFSPALYAAILALLLWSGTAVANKIAVGHMSGLTVGVLRSILAGIFAMPVVFLLRLPFPQSAPDRILLTVSGVTSFVIWPILLSAGIERTTAGHAALIMAMIPVFAVFFAAIVRRRLPRAGWWLGTAIALAATIAVIVGRGISLEASADGSSIVGDLIIFAGVVVCAIGYVAGGKLAPKIGTVATTFWGLSMALVFLIPVFGWIFGRTAWADVPTEGWLAVAWLTLLSSLAGYALWFYALGRGGIGRIGSLQLLMPVTALAVAVIVLGENLTMSLIASCVAIVLGTFLARRYAD